MPDTPIVQIATVRMNGLISDAASLIVLRARIAGCCITANNNPIIKRRYVNKRETERRNKNLKRLSKDRPLCETRRSLH